MTFLFSTHNPEILNYANRTIRLRDGLVVDSETAGHPGAAAPPADINSDAAAPAPAHPPLREDPEATP